MVEIRKSSAKVDKRQQIAELFKKKQQVQIKIRNYKKGIRIIELTHPKWIYPAAFFFISKLKFRSKTLKIIFNKKFL